MIIELAPHLEQIAIKKAQQYNMRTEDFINKLVESNLVDDVLFNYDLERMKYMMDTEFTEVPDHALTDFESFDKWLMGVAK